MPACLPRPRSGPGPVGRGWGEQCEPEFPFPPLRGKVGMGGDGFKDGSPPPVSSPIEGEEDDDWQFSLFLSVTPVVRGNDVDQLQPVDDMGDAFFHALQIRF